ncbi:MAG TPA: prepilin-type N-terminal cleavage/methylation domain-containing protein [bacterium]|nr:prepilin-type N-terminal cleavage/methylation domain-containing protein [bacterium]
MTVKKLKSSPVGFTLIEVIVTLGIVTIIITFGLLSSQRNTPTSTYSLSRDLLSSDLRLTSAKALNAERFQGQEPTGWGVHFIDLSNSYTIFADLNSNRTYDAKEKFRTVNLNPDLKVKWENYATGDVVFNATDGKTFLNNVEMPITPTAYLLIDIKNQNNATVKILQINPLGSVSN